MLSVQKETAKPNVIKPSHFSIDRIDRLAGVAGAQNVSTSINISTPNAEGRRIDDTNAGPNRIITSVTNGTSGDGSNVIVGITRNLTRQISNLSVRTRGNTSWHNLAIGNNLVRFGIQNSMAQNIYEIRLNNNNSNNNGTSNPNNSANGSNGADGSNNDAQNGNFVPNASQQLLLQINTNASANNPAAVNTSPQQMTAPAQALFNALNQMFQRGDFPMPQRDFIMDFHGIVTLNIANKLSTWLLANFRSHELVQELFLVPNQGPQPNVLELFRRFGVEMETINGVETLKKEQSLNILVFLTYMLQVAGYSNSYFL
jgi:hypothetical protein